MRRLFVAVLLTISTVFPARVDAASVAQTWPVDKEPFGVTVDPRDGLVYVANSDASISPFGGGLLSIIDPRSSSPRTVAISFKPIMSAIDPSLGQLFVTTARDWLLVIDLQTMSEVHRSLGGGLGIAVDQQTHRVYSTWSDGLAVMDGATGLQVTRLAAPVGDAWWGVALDPSTHRIYLTNLNVSAPSLVVLDDRDLSLVANIPLPEIPRFALAVDAARQLVYVSGYTEAGNLYVIDATSLHIARTISVGSFPISATLVPETDRLYVSNVGSRSLSIVDTTTLALVQTIALPWQPGQSALHPDGRLYVSGFDARLAGAILLTNSAPVIDSVILSPSPPGTNDVLQSSIAAHDADADPLTYRYEWLRNGVSLAGATGPSLDLSMSGHGDRGDTISVRVTASDGQATSELAMSSVVVADSAPTASVVLDVTTPTTNEVIIATVTSSDADGDGLTWTFTWKVNGNIRQVVSGANGSDRFDLSSAGNGDRGDTIAVDVVASDGTLQSPTASAAAIVANTPPMVTVSLSDTTPRTNQILTATAAGADADADALSYTYTWRVNGVLRRTVSTPSTSDSFDVGLKGNGDNGDTVDVSVFASDSDASSVAAGATAIVTPGGR